MMVVIIRVDGQRTISKNGTYVAESAAFVIREWRKCRQNFGPNFAIYLSMKRMRAEDWYPASFIPNAPIFAKAVANGLEVVNHQNADGNTVYAFRYIDAKGNKVITRSPMKPQQ